jgi:hypothetical protein
MAVRLAAARRGRVAGPVVGQENLLEAGLDAPEVEDLIPCGRLHERVERAQDGAPEHGILHGEVADAGDPGERLRRHGRGEVDLEAPQRPLLEDRDRLDCEQPAFADYSDPVAEVLDLRQLMRRDEDRPAFVPGLLAEVLELDLDEGVQAGRRLVHDQQVGPDHEGRHQAYLLLVAPGKALDLLGGVELEAGNEPLPIRRVHRALEIAEVGEQLPAGQLPVERELAGDVAHLPIDRQPVVPDVEPEHARVPARRPDEVQQQPDGRGFAGPVGSQEAEYLARLDDKVDVDDAA